MTLLTIAGKDVLLLLRDKKALVTLVGTPLILTLILGMAFSSMWSSDLPPSLILWINGDSGGYGDILFDEVLIMEGIREWTRTEEAAGREEAMDRVRRGEATVLIEIPAGFSQDLARGRAEITVVGDPGSSIRANIITQIVEHFAAELSSRAVIHSALHNIGVPLPPADIEAALASLQLRARVDDGFEPAQQESTPIPMDYYAAGMGVMYLLFTVTHGASTFLRERETYTLARMYQSPARPWHIGSGKFVGIFAIAMLQMLAVIVFSRLVFNVNWGNWLGVAALTAAAAFAASGIGLLIAAVSRSHSGASALGTLIVLPMSVLGGSMVPLFALPEIIRALSRLTVNGWAMDGYVRLMFEGAGPSGILTHLLALIAAGLALIAVAGTILSRKGVTP